MRKGGKGGVRTALTIGTFDCMHLGHSYLFRRCEELADRLVVGVNTDEFVAAYKKFTPLYKTAERMSVIAQLGYEVCENASAGRELVFEVAPDFLVVGSDWLHRDYLAQIDMTADDFEALDCSLVYIPRIEGVSASDIRRRAASWQT